eukprot:PITA_26710
MACSPSASSFPTSHPETQIQFESNWPSASAAAYPSDDKNYQVFINHRGPDVKKTFASILYRSLVKNGLKVFLDQSEMKEGEKITSQIEGAIRSASIHVAIFSPRYAESQWCLNELVLMRESGSTIIPVFYHVNPSELKRTNGLYAKALHNLENKKTHEEKLRYDSTTIENWRNALFDVAGISGFELEACNDDEGELLENVVKRVLKILKRASLEVAKYPCGLNEKVNDFENIVQSQQQSGKLMVVGIVGLGGMGKTTLAKELFNRKSSQYSRSCFLWNKNKEKSDLQKELFHCLNGSDVGAGNMDEVLGKHRKHEQAFVILDDANNVDQVDAVLAFQTVLSSDSLIVITSRDRDVLTKSRIQDASIYKLCGLSPQHSRDLFCAHAFDKPYPLPGFESLVDRFLKVCDGLPFSLRVLGLLVRGENNKSRWGYRLDQVQKNAPKEIQETLRISFDGLEREEKEIFLDIASFFINERRDMAIRLWDGSGWNGLLGFQTLQNKSLVEVDSEDKIKMHNHLRDMGREIGEVSSLPRRFCGPTANIDDFLHNEQLITQVRGIRTGISTARDNESAEVRGDRESWYQRILRHDPSVKSLSRLRNSNLKLLDVEDGDWLRISERLDAPNLLWLRWRKCSYSSLHKVPLKNLRVLEVISSVLKKLWKGQDQAPLQLRELVIDSPLSKLPKSIGRLKDLELIILKCPSMGKLKSLPDEFCDLTSLRHFELTGCSEMKYLPDSLGNLENLEHINLSWSENLRRLPNSFGALMKLKYLDLSGCSNLTISSETLGDIRKLEYINLSGCTKVEVLPPNSFGALMKLKYLDLSGCSNLTISSETLGDIRKLEYINLSGCTKVEVLPPQVAHQLSLEKLYWKFLEMVPSPLYVNLKELKLRKGNNCKELNSLPIPDEVLTQLAKLTVNECVFSEGFVKGQTAASGLGQLSGERISGDLSSSIDMSKLVQLQHIELYKTEISEVSFAEGFCPNLQHLLIKSCNGLVKLGTLPNALVKLELTSCDQLQKIEGLCGLAKLQILNIKWCSELKELSSIETLVSLEVLDVQVCGKLERIERLAGLTKLRRWDIDGCPNLIEVSGDEHLMSLTRFDTS